MTRRRSDDNSIAQPIIVRVLVVIAMVFAASFLDAAPAAAHGAGGASASNYSTVLRSVTPAVVGVTLRVVEPNQQLELTNETADDVVVIGYDNEPYLRVGPSGTFVNKASPAYYLNRSVDGSTLPPPGADSSREPDWKLVSRSHSTRWHDHRVHWMSENPPPQVAAAPGSRHVVIPEWTIELRKADVAMVGKGELLWIPGPNPIGWYVFAVVAAVIAFCAVFGKFGRQQIVVAGSGLLLVDVVHLVGVASSSTGSVLSRLGQMTEASTPSLIALVMGIYGVVGIWRLRPDASWYLLFSAVMITVLAGFSDVGALTKSQLPSALPDALARGSISLSAGLGVGMCAASSMMVRRARHAHATSTDQPTEV